MPKDKSDKREHSRRYIYECEDSDDEAYSSKKTRHNTSYVEHGHTNDRRFYNEKTPITSSNRRGCLDNSLCALDSSPYYASKSNHKSSRDREKQKDSWRKEDRSRQSSDVETPWKQKLVDYEDGSSDSDLPYSRCSESRPKKNLWKNRDNYGEVDHRHGRNHFTDDVASPPSTKQSRYQMDYRDRHRDINGDWRHEKKKKKRHSKERNEEK